MRKRLRLKSIASIFLAVSMIIQPFGELGLTEVQAGTVDATKTVARDTSATYQFDTSSLDGWTTEKGTATYVETDGQTGGYVKLAANSSISITVNNIEQGSYTLSAWFRGAASNNVASFEVEGTGGPDSLTLVDTYLKADTWKQVGNRNVLIYNGQATITITSGSTALDVDLMELVQDSSDENNITNWDFESGTTGWTTTGSVSVDKNNKDTGAQGITLGDGSEISQVINVEPNTKYSMTVRAKVDTSDTFESEICTNEFGKSGELVHRLTTGDRLNVGVRGTDATVLRQAPSGTEDYSLVTVTFTTGAEQTQVEVYANTIYDQAYKDSVTLYHNVDETYLADEWTGNGSDKAYVDNFDIFTLEDNNFLRGADVSYLSKIEDSEGTYYANGVQQDCLRILSNHGVNSVIAMTMVQAGNICVDPDTLLGIYKEDPNGNTIERRMIKGGYFDKTHSVAIAKRANELGMSYMASFQYSDMWMSAGKAHTPLAWLEQDYEGNYSNSDIQHLQSIVYNYVYDTLTALKDEGVELAGIKHGNEQNQGVCWPVGKSTYSAGHVKIVTASYDAAEAVYPGISGYVHSNTGYTTSGFIQDGMISAGASMDGAAFSLYGGRSSSSILTMANYMQTKENLKYLDYINVETGFSFTNYRGTSNTGSGSMVLTEYYRRSGNGQYNWLLDYMQAAFDTANPHGQTRGFYYWETDWIPTPGAESTYCYMNDIDNRTMFNNGDTTIHEMGSTLDGKSGDMMDSMYAYLMRGVAKDQTENMNTPLTSAGAYTVASTEATAITFENSAVSLEVGETERIHINIEPANQVLTDGLVTYTSSNPGVATVTENTGYIHGVSAGTATITAKVGNVTNTVAVTIAAEQMASDVTLTVDGTEVLDGEALTANIFDKLQLSAALDASVTEQSVIYTSSNTDVADFFGESWQTPDGQMMQQTDVAGTLVELKVKNAGTTTIKVASVSNPEVYTTFTVTVEKTAVESVTLDKTSATLSYGRKLQLNATVAPENTTLYKVNWSSSDEKIATVSSTGVVTGTGIGVATITATSDDNAEVKATCKVTVTEVKAESVALDKEEIGLKTGEKTTIHAILTPSDTYNKEVNWTSDNTRAATVDAATGEVTGVAAGVAHITATTKDGGFTASCTVNVSSSAVAVTGLALSDSEYYFTSDYFADTAMDVTAPVYGIKAKVEPATATSSDVTWTSDCPQVATVDEYGYVTAVSEGVAVITATSADGEHKATTKVYVPTNSESFDNRDASTDYWNTSTGLRIGSNSSITIEEDRNQVLTFTSSVTGTGTSRKKLFAEAITSDEITVSFDWNVGTSENSQGNFISLTDNANMPYFSIQTNANAELVYAASGAKLATNVPVHKFTGTTAQQVGEGFNVDNTWYHLIVHLNTAENTGSFTITSLENPELTATHEFELDSTIAYAGLQRIHMGATALSGMKTTSTMKLDNVNIYKASSIAKEIELSDTKVKLIPVKGTLGISKKVTASISPLAADQAVTWKSSNTSVAKVSADGTITAAKTYDSLDKIVEGTCTITATSVADASIAATVAVTVTRTPGASEAFSIQDENGIEVYSANTVLELETGDTNQLEILATGGDGKTDLASIEWITNDESVVTVDPNTGLTKAVGAGTTTVELTVGLYNGDTLHGIVHFSVTGESLADTTGLATAIQSATDAKTYPDGYYTEASLAAYSTALTHAESMLAQAQEENWKVSVQATLDSEVTALGRAVAALTKRDNIPIEEITLQDASLAMNKKVMMPSTLTPEYATESVTWSSSDISVAIINKTTGEILPLATGTTTITAMNEAGTITGTATVTVISPSDLTSDYALNGVTITGTGVGSNTSYSYTGPFDNAKAGTLNGTGTWSSGSPTKGGTIMMDLGSPAVLDRMLTTFWGSMYYTIDVSTNGDDWTTVIDHSATAGGVKANGATEAYTDTFPADTTARYVRFTAVKSASSSEWVGVKYMQLYGTYTLADTIVSGCDVQSIPVEAGEELTAADLPATVSVDLTNAATETADLPVTWNAEEVAAVAAKVLSDGGNKVYTINGSVEYNGYTYPVSCEIRVSESTKVIDLTDIAINMEDITLFPGYQVTLQAVKTPANATESITWSSSKTDVATIDETTGELTAVSAGTTVITAAGSNGTIQKNKTITVKEPSDLTSDYTAKGVTITATGTGSNTSYLATGPFDNAAAGALNGSGQWSTGAYNKKGAIVMDLGSATTLSSIKTTFWNTMTYTVDVSTDGENWTTAIDHTAASAGVKASAATEPYTDNFPQGTVAQYVRLSVIQSSTKTDWIGVKYIQLLGEAIADSSEDKREVDDYTTETVNVTAGDTLTVENLPKKVAVVSGAENLSLDVTWDSASVATAATNVKNATAEATYVITGTVTLDGATYSVTCKVAVTIPAEEDKTLTDADVTVKTTSYDYDGSAKEPEIVVARYGSTLIEDIDYSVSYSDNVNAGTAKVTVTGKGSYDGTVEKTYTIERASINAAVVSVLADRYIYDGTEKTPVVKVTLGNKELTAGTEYVINYLNNVNAGTATVSVSGANNYTGTATATFTIFDKTNLKNAVVTLAAASYVYDGTAKTPDVSVKISTTTLKAGTDYKVSYQNNTAIGTALVTITGMGAYEGTVTKTFVIEQASMNDATITLSAQTFNYDGKAQQPSITVKMGAATLKAGTDYVVSYQNNVKIGDATVTITGLGNYTDTVVKTYKITIAKNKTYTVGNYQYKITKASTNGTGTVTLSKVVKKTSTVNIGATVTIGGKKFKITAIGKNVFKNNTKIKKVTIGSNVTTIGSSAFYGCKKLKTITISGKKLTTKSIGSKAFKGIYSKATIKVPSSKLKSYKKILLAKGVTSKAKIKK